MDTLHFQGDIVTPAGTALSGQVSVDLWDDGSWRTHFEMHSSSIFEPFDYDVRAYVMAPNFPTLVFRHTGHVPPGGHSIPPDESGVIPYIAMYWDRLKAGHQFAINKDYSVGGVLGTIADVFDEIARLFSGAAGVTFGVVIGVTKDAIGWLGATLGPGGTIGIIGGTVFFAVSAALGIGIGAAALVGTVAAVVICVVTDLATDTRPLEDAERALAERVFGDTVPLDDIRLTSLAGPNGRGFTARGIDGKIYVNLGRTFSNPLGVSKNYPYPGQLLIHELTHAWQIEHNFLPTLMCSMLVTDADNTLVDNQYHYGDPGPPWDSFNPEQQGAIVDQWYAGSGNSDGWPSMDQQNLYYGYIWDDVLQHAPALTAPTTLRTSGDSRLTTNTRRPAQRGVAWPSGSPPGVAELEDAFWVAGDGSLVRQGTSDDSSELWSGNQPAALSAAGLTSPDGPVVVVSRSPTIVDAFCIDPSGAVVTANVSGPMGLPKAGNFTQICPPGTGSARPGSPLAALSRTPRTLDVFWVGPDGAITSTWWNADLTGVWTDNPPFAVTGANAAQAGSGLAALSRLAEHIDLFWVGGVDGAIQSQYWDGSGPPGGWAEHSPFAITAPGAARLGSPVVAVSRVPEQIDVFWIGPYGSIMTQWWHAGDGTGWADHGPFPIAPDGSAGPGSGLTVVARTQEHLDAFWIGPGNAVMTQWWDGAPHAGWTDHAPFGITAAGAAHAGSPLSAVCRDAENINVCFVGPDGAILAQWWAAGSGTGWADHGPEVVGPPGSMARDYDTAQHAAAHLQAQSAALANVGDAAGAIDAIRRAVDVLVRADVSPGEQEQYTRQLAMTELDLVFRLLSGPKDQFVAATEDAVLACQRAVAADNDPVTFAGDLRTLSSWASGAGEAQAAVDAIAAAAGILTPLAPEAGHETVFYQTLALVLFDLFARQAAAGRPDLAAAAAEETVQAYRQLAAAGGQVIDVSDQLMKLSFDTSLAGALLATAAVDAARAAADILQAAVEPPEDDLVRRARLANAELVLAERLIAAGRSGEAMEPAQSAVTMFQALADADATDYDGQLAQAQAVLAALG
jgi:hypothetical protein